jgi:erythrocyte band 7 integral membrane protein
MFSTMIKNTRMLGVSTLHKRNFFTIVEAHNRGVKLTLGKYVGVLEPGVYLNIPIIHTIYGFDIRDRVVPISEQSLISTDNVSFRVTASVQYRIVNPKNAFLNTDNIYENVNNICKMELRNVLGSREINDILINRDIITTELIERLSDIEQSWGLKITRIQVDDITFDETMKKSMASKAEADRNAEAKLIIARADVETAKEYKKAAEIYQETPISMKLREYQLWQSVSKNPSNTIYVVPSNLTYFNI